MKPCKFAKESWHNGQKMTLVGHWSDLCGYYYGETDGNAWKWQGSWVNCGSMNEFARHFTSRCRGEMYQTADA